MKTTLSPSLPPETSYHHGELMLELKTKHSFIAELIGGGRFHFTDMPIYGNIGDLLILHGTLEFFKSNQIRPASMSSFFEFSPKWVNEDDVIVFQGGGNFGDLYLETQRFREKVVAEKTANRIIILPQTIHFTSMAEQRKAARLFRKHPDLHFCTRDEQSYQIARHFSDHVYLVPDMAHQLFPVHAQRADTERQGALLLRRVDGERRARSIVVTPDVTCVTDWPELVGRRERRIEYYRKTARWMRRTRLAGLCGNALAKAWTSYSDRLIADAIALFATHDHIITDRLHGHILACLMSKPNTVIDNSYGKNHGYLSAWTSKSALVQWRPTMQG